MNEIEERRNRLEEMAQDLIESLPDSGGSSPLSEEEEKLLAQLVE